MKRRITGRVNKRLGMYEVLSPDGNVMKSIPLNEAGDHSKLKAAIERNKWEPVDG